ncbi:MAG: hypothetical protein HYV63_26380 [Candidatus Schekmanbacteria bacterium]|nr:hypothetical protein [Candidatus Schekmanbacteria bacterium]
MNTTFPHSYECERLPETPTATLPHYYYPGASTKGGRDGILVEIRPERGHAWRGTFAFGQLTPNGVSGIFAMPDPGRFCVVSRGEGYIVDAATPGDWEAVRAKPIIDVRLVPTQGIIVFANFTELVAYGSAGIKWRTKRLTWDSLKITDVSDAFIKGEFWDIRSEATACFTVDLATGAHLGGIKEI